MHNKRINDEKASDFKSAIKRLFKELGIFKVFIVIAIMLAVFSSILSIVAPNRLSDLTDEITKGLVVNTKNLKKISKNIENSMTEAESKITEILSFRMDETTALSILNSDKVNDTDKTIMAQIMKDFSENNQKSAFQNISSLSNNTLKLLLKDSTYNNVTITKNDKIKLLKLSKDKKNMNLPESVGEALINEITIDGVTITSKDQAKLMNLLKGVDLKNSKKVYQKLDKAPKNILKVIEPKMNKKQIKKIVILLIIIYILSSLFNFIEMLIMTTVSNNFARNLRNRISKKINVLPLKYFDKHQIGDTLSRVTNDVDTIAQSLNQSLSSLVSDIVLFLGCILMMFITNAIMAGTALLASILGFLFMGLILKNSQKYFKARQRELGLLNGHIEEVYSGLNVVKVYNAEKEASAKFDEYNKKVYDANRKSQFLSGLMMPMMGFIGNFGYVAVCIVGALLVMKSQITFGVIVAFMLYVRIFTSPLSKIAQAFTMLQSTAAASERVFEFLDEEEFKSEEELPKLDKESIKGKVEFKNVSFTYDGNASPTIKNFNASIKPGEKVAIVGPTGAGKTTLVNLLMKFYEITDGEILIDDIPINKIKRSDIASFFTMVLQDTWVFNGTVTDNIRFNRNSTSHEKVVSVCKTVGLDHFIRTLPKTYNSIIKNNDSISAGEKQLLTIARGMIEDAPLLILDEATSNVDTRTEELVQSAMDKLMKGRTSFIIAHRLSTIKNADLILVLKDGNIIEQGNHDALMKEKGFYYELYNSQFEL